MFFFFFLYFRRTDPLFKEGIRNIYEKAACIQLMFLLCKSRVMVQRFSDTKRRLLTRAATHILRHDAAEVPEARLAAVALLSPDPGLTGALPGDWIARALVGAVDVALTGA